MSESETTGLLGSYLFFAGGIWTGSWWAIVPTALLAVACTLAAIPVRGGGDIVTYDREPDALDEIVETLRRIEKSQYSE